jgi:hypothetical protein
MVPDTGPAAAIKRDPTLCLDRGRDWIDVGTHAEVS